MPVSQPMEKERTRSQGWLARSLVLVFKTTLVAFLLLGIVLVLTQLVGALLSAPGVVAWAMDTLFIPMTTCAAIAGLAGFAISYVLGWDTSD